MCFVVVVLAAIPFLYGLLSSPKGARYLGFEYNLDDHMVYAAWMRQAMDGHFLFDNRFTTDSQPGLTVHLYFWLLGQIARLLGIPLTATLARLFFSGLFVHLLYRLIKRLSDSVFTTRLIFGLVLFGGGLGFLVWHNFGRDIVRPETLLMSNLTFGKLPIDVWQPEAFIFPSILTNSLFMVSLCLVLFAFDCYLRASEGWKTVVPGCLAMGVLMNIHSYDVLLLALVLAGFAVMEAGNRRLSFGWLSRAGVITFGVVPAALWFVHVLQSDAVFQMRAGTPTFSANFQQVFSGLTLLILFGLGGIGLRAKSRQQQVGLGIICLLILLLLVLANKAPGEAYFLGPGVWVALFAMAVTALYLTRSEEPVYNLILAWAVIGLTAIYFPALFQRKLAEGLAIPWAILAALGISQFLKDRERNRRNLATVMVLLLCGATSISWLMIRDRYLIQANVSNTTVHAPYLSRDAAAVIDALSMDPKHKVVLAMPGIAAPETDSEGNPVPDSFATPILPDFNPIISGLTGAYTYAGHWSETPDYLARRSELTRFFLARTDSSQREAFLRKVKPDYIVAPSAETYGSSFADLTSLGETIYSGNQFALIKIRK